MSKPTFPKEIRLTFVEELLPPMTQGVLGCAVHETLPNGNVQIHKGLMGQEARELWEYLMGPLDDGEPVDELV